MWIVVSWPVVDARVLVDGNLREILGIRNRTPGAASRAFLRGFGPEMPRGPGINLGIAGEESFFRARNAIRFTSPISGSKPFLRRLFFDGFGIGRLELGIEYRAALTDAEIFAKCSEIVNQAVNAHGKKHPLIESAPSIRQSYLAATTKRDSPERRELVQIGNPILFVSAPSEVYFEPGHYFESAASSKPTLTYLTIKPPIRKVLIWLRREDAVLSTDSYRNFRTAALRVHSARESAAIVLGLVSSGNLPTQRKMSDAVQKFLFSCATFLGKEGEIFGLVNAFDGSVLSAQRDTIIEHTKSFRPAVRRSINRILNVQGDLNMNTYNQSGTGNSMAVSTGDGSATSSATTIADPARASLIRELKEELARIEARLPDAWRAEVLEKVSRIEKEASTEKPKKEWYEVSASGLRAAAAALGNVLNPLIAIVDRLKGYFVG